MSDPPAAVSPAVRNRMRAQRRQNTAAELDVRRILHRAGMRYRVGFSVPGMARRSIDIAFTRAHVAIFIDGCYWHRCPQHHVPARHNSGWWAEKLEGNVRRDRDTTEHLMSLGWYVRRFWEHEDPRAVASEIVSIVRHEHEKRTGVWT